MQLPTKKSTKVQDFSEQIILVHGQPKIGKTTFASGFDALFIATEPGHKHQEIYMVPTATWEQTLDACKALAQSCQRAEGKAPWSMIVIDTLDQAYDQCLEYICRREKVEHPSEGAHGKIWAMITNELCRVIMKLAHLPLGLMLISHSRQVELTTTSGKILRWEPSLPGTAKSKLLGLVDITLFFTMAPSLDKKLKGGEQRVIFTKPTRAYEAGDRSGLLPEQLEMSATSLLKAWEKATKKEA